MDGHRSPRRTRETPASYNAQNVTERELKAITRRIVRAAHPEMIILFGSRAYGTPRPDSDLDLLVVMEQEGSYAERIAPFKKLFPHPAIPLDIQPRTPNEVTRRLEMGDEFMQVVVGRGQKIYPLRTKNGFVHEVKSAMEKGRTQPMSNAPLVLEWVEKAEGDFVTAQLLARHKKDLKSDNLCWNCQQCVEKYLKAFFTRHRIPFGRIHELDELYASCLTVDADFRLIKSHLDKADVCKPNIRYPGNSVPEQDAREAFVAAKSIRKFVRAKLGLR